MSNFVIELDERVILVRGHHAGQILRTAGMKPLWSHIGKGHVLDRTRLPDVRAALEVAGHRYRETPRGSR